MDEAAAAGVPVRLEVASSNDPSVRLYQRLGFRRDAPKLRCTSKWNGGRA